MKTVHFTYQKYWLRVLLIIPSVFIIFFIEERICTHFGIKSIFPVFVAVAVFLILDYLYFRFIKKPFYRQGTAEITDSQLTVTLGNKQYTIPLSQLNKKVLSVNRRYQLTAAMLVLYYVKDGSNKKLTLYSPDIPFDECKYQPFDDIASYLNETK